MVTRDRAEYMKRYRTRKAVGLDMKPTIAVEVAKEPVNRVPALEARIKELEEEVRQLKRRLATQASQPASPAPRFVDVSFGSSRPAPKPGKKA